jgi:hypothetical protein
MTDLVGRIWPAYGTPAEIISQRAVKLAENDVLLPNPFAKDVIRRTLRNGDEMLFAPADLDAFGHVDQLSSAWLSYLTKFASQVADRKLRMVVLLVPNKYTVYGSLVSGAPAPREGERLLDAIEAELNAAGMPVVNITSTFQRVASESLMQRDYLYWRDDMHWNARGINLAAEELTKRMPRQ